MTLGSLPRVTRGFRTLNPAGRRFCDSHTHHLINYDIDDDGYDGYSCDDSDDSDDSDDTDDSDDSEDSDDSGDSVDLMETTTSNAVQPEYSWRQSSCLEGGKQHNLPFLSSLAVWTSTRCNCRVLATSFRLR